MIEVGITFLPDSFSRFGQAEVFGLQAPVVMAALAVVAHYGLAYTRFFRQIYYIGSNAKAAHLSGIKVERLQILSFTLMGMIAGVAGIVYASRIATASATVKHRGGIAGHHGGHSRRRQPDRRQGTIWGAMVGVFFMALMKNVLIISRVSSEWQGIILGGVLVLAVAVDSVMNRKRT